jgi:hypothetical protein
VPAILNQPRRKDKAVVTPAFFDRAAAGYMMVAATENPLL